MHFFDDLVEADKLKFKTTNPPICLACGATCPSDPYVIASSKGLIEEINPNDDTTSTYYRCDNCGSITDKNKESNYYESSADDAFMQYYYDCTAGISEMIEPILLFQKRHALHENKDVKYLEIGCGLGFAVDFCDKILRWSSSGLEPGSWGSIASSTLAVDVYQEYLGQGSRFDNKKYNLIYASEVIEHIQNPLEFIATLKNSLTLEGYIILTTPNADYIHKRNPTSDNYSLLFPGEHKIIFSELGIRTILEQVDLKDIYIIERQNGKDLLIECSIHYQGEPSPSPTTEEFKNNQDEYMLKYYNTFFNLNKGNKPSEGVRRGMLYRALKIYIDRGQFEEVFQLLIDSESTDPILVPYSANYQNPLSLQDKTNILLNALQTCYTSMIKEWQELKATRNTFPQSGASHHKLLGYYLCNIVHQICPFDNQEDQAIYKLAINYLEVLLEYITFIEISPHGYYHLELLSMKGPALSSLILAKAKLQHSFNLKERHSFYYSSKFKEQFARSHQDIEQQIEIHPNLSHQISYQEFQKLYSLRKQIQKLKASKLYKIYKQLRYQMSARDCRSD